MDGGAARELILARRAGGGGGTGAFGEELPDCRLSAAQRLRVERMEKTLIVRGPREVEGTLGWWRLRRLRAGEASSRVAIRRSNFSCGASRNRAFTLSLGSSRCYP